MKRQRTTLIAIALLALSAASCSNVATEKPKSSVTEYGAFELIGKGVQIYECKPKTDDPTKSAWTFKEPKADLFDSQNRKVGTHYAGPTWESDADHSKVVAARLTGGPAPDPAKDIDWLFLARKTTEGNGMFSQVKSLQRVNTSGGKAPAAACDPNNKEPLQVPYTATYYFYIAKP